MLIMALVLGGIANHCVAYLTDLNHSPTRAAFAWSLVMGAMVLGKLCFGPIADHYGSKISMVVSCFLFAVSIVILMFARPFSVVLIFACIYGFASGAPLVINPLLASDYLGMKHFGAIYGVLNIMGTVGGAIGPVAAGFIFDAYHNYLPVFYVSVPLMLVTALVASRIKKQESVVRRKPN
jgi:MFS family permease